MVTSTATANAVTHWILLAGVLVFTGCSYYVDGVGGLILLYMAAVPVGFLLLVLSLQEAKPRLGLVVYFFLCGCSVSIVVATVLETLSQLSSIKIWRCEANADAPIPWQCNLSFSLCLMLSIGLVEEFSKLLPVLVLIRTNEDHIPKRHPWMYVVAESPTDVILAGCAAAGGFACIENIKYVLFSTSDMQEAFDTSLVRAVLAIPFHISCTGIAAAALASRKFLVPSSLEDDDHQHPPRHVTTLIWKNIARLISAKRGTDDSSALVVLPLSLHSASSVNSADLNIACQTPLLGSERGSVYSTSLLSAIVKTFAVPVTCHTVYDLSLFLASQMMTITNYGPGLAVCATAYIASYVTAITLFVKNWRTYKKLSRTSIPRLHPHLDSLL